VALIETYMNAPSAQVLIHDLDNGFEDIFGYWMRFLNFLTFGLDKLRKKIFLSIKRHYPNPNIEMRLSARELLCS